MSRKGPVGGGAGSSASAPPLPLAPSAAAAAAGAPVAAGRYAKMQSTLSKSMNAWRDAIDKGVFASSFPSLMASDPGCVPAVFDQFWKQLCETVAVRLQLAVAGRGAGVQRCCAIMSGWLRSTAD